MPNGDIVQRGALLLHGLEGVTTVKRVSIGHQAYYLSLEYLRNNVGPSNETPVLFNSARDGDLLTDLCTGGAGQAELSSIGLDTENLGTGSSGTDVDHENFVLGELGDLGLLAIGGLDTEQTTEKEVVNLNLSVDSRKAATVTENETDETIGTAKGGVDTGTDTDETTGNSELEVVVLGEQGDDAGENGAALNLALLVLSDETGTDLNLVVQLHNTSQDRSTGNTTLKLVNLGTGLVDIEGTNDHHVGGGLEVTGRDGDGVDEGLVDSVDVVLQLGGDGNNRRAIGDGTTDELENRLVVLKGVVFTHKIDLILENNDVAELHDLNGGQMLGSLGLRAGFVSGNEKESGVLKSEVSSSPLEASMLYDSGRKFELTMTAAPESIVLICKI